MLQMIILLVILVLLAITIYLLSEERRIRKESLPHAQLGHFWDGKERRKDLRCEKCCDAQYHINPDSDKRVSAQSENISVGGVKLVLDELLSKGTPLTVDIAVSDEQKPITAKGEIAWVKEVDPDQAEQRGKRIFQAGVKFVNMTPEDETRLRNHVEEIC